jgi:hypothetical protein
VSVALAAYAEWLSTLRPLGDALDRTGRTRNGQLALYRGYQERLFELTGGARERVLLQAAQLTPTAQRARAAHRFEGDGAAARALRFLLPYAGPGQKRGLHAVVYVDNRDGPPMTLDALRAPDGVVRIRGKLTLVVTGAIELRNVRLADRANDLFVVQAGGTLIARERVEASLIAGGAFRPSEGLDLAGNLILAGDFDPASLQGRLDRDGGRYVSGAGRALRGVYTQAALSPWPVKSFVERSVP